MKQPRQDVIQELLSPEFIAKLKQADVILGVDEDTKHEFILFGRSTCRAVAATGVTKGFLSITVPILQETDELEALCAAVAHAKGYDEYEAAPTATSN